MKTTIYIIIIICFVFPLITNAQTEKGKMLLGVSSRIDLGCIGASAGHSLMSIGFVDMKYKSDADEDSESNKFNGFNLTPRFGYFLANNFVAGLDLNFSRNTQKYAHSESKDITSIFSAGPFVRYYLPTGKVKPFLEGHSYFGSINCAEKIDNKETWASSASNTIYGGGLGVALPVGDKASFDIGFWYNSNTIKNKENNENNNRTVIGDYGLRFSFVFLLGKAKG